MKSRCANTTAGCTVETLLVSLAAVVFWMGPVAAQSSQEGAALRIASIRPTVFFVSDEGHLFQVAEVIVENASAETVDAVVEASLAAQPPRSAIGRLPTGKTTLQVTVPDIRKSATDHVATLRHFATERFNLKLPHQHAVVQ